MHMQWPCRSSVTTQQTTQHGYAAGAACALARAARWHVMQDINQQQQLSCRAGDAYVAQTVE
jgi:hypothetical protein